jgi:hypothetical protein
LLKAAVIHDLLEDVPETDEQDLRQIDDQANQVVDLVLEVSRPKGMLKTDFMERILKQGSYNSKLLTQLENFVYKISKKLKYVCSNILILRCGHNLYSFHITLKA